MASPEDAYRQGYEKGRRDNLADNVGQALFGLLTDDPGGYFQAGYSDGAAGKKFNPPSGATAKPSSPQAPPSDIPASDLERAWYRLCNSSDFIPQELVARYTEALRLQGSYAAIVVGLHDFMGHTCPRCGDSGQFKIHFLGHIKHPSCGWSGFMSSGSYIGYQVAQIFQSGARAAGSMKEEADRKGEKGTGWIHGILTFIFVGVFRAGLAVLLIPLHGIVALLHPDQTPSERVNRAIILVIALGVVGFGVYEVATKMTEADKGQLASGLSGIQSSQPTGLTPLNQFTKPKKTHKLKSVPPVAGKFYVLLNDHPETKSNWISAAQQGTFQLNWFSPQPILILAQPTNPPSGVTLYSQQILNGDVAATFIFDHQGRGRTMVGLWSVATNNWGASATLDTDDTNYLNFAEAGGPSTEYKYSGTPYMNKMTSLQIRVVNSAVYFLADGVPLETMPLSVQGGFRAALSVGSVAWKSGANQTSFHIITANGS